jgi:hypothetical protein
VGLHVVGDQGESDVVIRGEFEFAAHAAMVVAVDLLTIMLVVDVAIVGAEQRADRALQRVRNQAAADAESGAAFVAAVVRLIDVAVGLGGGCLAGDVEHAGRGVLAEQRALRAAQNLDALQIEQIHGCLSRTRIHHAIDHRRHGWLDARRGGNRADAAHEQRGVFVRCAGTEIQRRHLLNNARHAVAVIAFELLAVDHRDRDRHFLQRLFASGCGDGDRLQRRLLIAAVSSECIGQRQRRQPRQ